MTPTRLGSGLLAIVLLGPGLLLAQGAQGAITVTAGSDGVDVPKKKKHVQPVYPQEALAQGIRGIVILELLIDTEGRVASVDTIRSIAGLDEAAIAAAQQWEYEVTKVDGQPVNVRLTVPITFALKLPEVSKQSGIPELRQGVTPPWPTEGGNGGHATADVTLDPDGRVGVARILEGEEPWSTSLIQALRTWRFAAPPDGTVVSFRVEADFVPGSESSRRVALRLTGLRESESLASAEPIEGNEATDVARLEPTPPAENDEGESGEVEPTPAGDETSAAGAAEDEGSATEPAAASADEPSEGAAEKPSEDEATSPPADDTGATLIARSLPPTEPAGSSEPAAPPAEPEAGSTTPETDVPAASGEAPGAEPAGQAAPSAASDATAPPPVEVITAAPPPLPPENGISALQGVTLEPGVPDLTRGRRPVAPPLARMAAESGSVEVDFSVGPGGTTLVGDVRGPDLLQPAARGAVESWTFRRTRADRLYLVAVFTYDGDIASATVRPQQP